LCEMMVFVLFVKELDGLAHTDALPDVAFVPLVTVENDKQA